MKTLDASNDASDAIPAPNGATNADQHRKDCSAMRNAPP
jgi:hypothetical protein